MRVSREKAAENRERILETATRLFRRKGFQGIGVADLMKEAGLTHGGFYGHFDSKEDLAVQACRRALEKGVDRWTSLAGGAPEDPLGGILAYYLSLRHRDDPGSGCAITALGPDVVRETPPVRRAFTEGLAGFVELLMRILPGEEARRRKRALVTLSGLIGAVVLARAVEDEALSEEILAAAAEAYGGGDPVNP